MESVENKCRVCLKIDRPSKLLPLDANNSEHAERIFLIAGIKIDDCYTKYLPNKICCNCADALIRAIEIQTLCLESYKLLMEELNDHHLSKSEKIKFEADEKLEIEEEYCEEVHLEEESDPHEFDDPTELDDSKTLECDVQVDKSATESNKLMNVAAHEICEHCGKSYSRKYIKTHLRTHREKEQKMKRFICDLCGLSFSLKCYTYSHMINIHLTSKKWICKAVSKDGTTCGRSYAKKHTYLGHLRVHSIEGRMYKCTFENCRKTFTQQHKLNVHTRIHTGERPYTCSYCGRGFIHYTDHKRHVMGHTGERPYKCQLPNCSRGFIKKSELTAHEKTHRLHQPHHQ